jgi:hypothetical protein
MHNIQASCGYNLSHSRLHILTAQNAIAWPSLLQGLDKKISLALEKYQQDPQNDLVRAAFIQTVNQVLASNAIIRDYFEDEKGYGFYVAKIVKAELNSWGNSNSYVAERLAIISQILIDKYHITNLSTRGSRPRLASKFPLHQLCKPPITLDYTKAQPANLFFTKHANQHLSLRLNLQGSIAIHKQIQMLTKSNLRAVKNAHICFELHAGSIPLSIGPLAKVLKSKLPNLTRLSFESVAFATIAYWIPNQGNQLNRLMASFCQHLKPRKQITRLDIDLSDDYIRRSQPLKTWAAEN